MEDIRMNGNDENSKNDNSDKTLEEINQLIEETQNELAEVEGHLLIIRGHLMQIERNGVSWGYERGKETKH